MRPYLLLSVYWTTIGENSYKTKTPIKISNRKSWVQLFLDPIIPKANLSLYNEKWLGVLPPLKELLGNHKNTFPLPFPNFCERKLWLQTGCKTKWNTYLNHTWKTMFTRHLSYHSFVLSDWELVSSYNLHRHPIEETKKKYSKTQHTCSLQYQQAFPSR